MPQGTTRKTSTRGAAPRVGTTAQSAPQPAADESRDMVASEPRRNPSGRSGRPSGPDGLKDDGTREAKRTATASTSQETRPTTRTRSSAAGRKTMASAPAASAGSATAKRTPARKDAKKASASEGAVGKGPRSGARTAAGTRGAAAATAKVTGLRPEGARGGRNRTPSRSDTPKGASTGRIARSR